jgi:acyl-CoA thioester hydrolase
MTKATPFLLEFDVRDYECDIEGIVNNSVYLNYFEHSRHEFLKRSGVSFIELHQSGFDAVVTRIEIDYHRPLMSGDRFSVRTHVRRKGAFRFLFDQSIVRESDGAITTEAIVTATFISEGRPVAPPEAVSDLFESEQG